MMRKIKIYAAAGILISLGLSSCIKKFDPSSYAPPLNINGYTASSQIASSNLVAHWGFNGDLTDSVSKVAGTANGTSFGTGILGQGLVGGTNAYVVSDVPPAIQQLHSFTFSAWVNMPASARGDVYELVGIANSQNFWS